TGDGVGTSDSIDTITIQAQMSDSCSIGTAGDMSFGQVVDLGTAREQTSVITFLCRAPWQVGLGNGSHYDGSHRRMAGPGGTYVTYELYRDPARSQRWGNTLNVDTVSGSANYETLTQVTVYGRVPAQAALPGSYSDTITVTLTFCTGYTCPVPPGRSGRKDRHAGRHRQIDSCRQPLRRGAPQGVRTQ